MLKVFSSIACLLLSIVGSCCANEVLTPTYLYKILSVENWEKSHAIIELPSSDNAFIHLATEEQLSKIIEKYWNHTPEFVVLKIDTKKLIGDLVFETNPGGKIKYYHLYHGCIPREAVVEIS